LTDILPTEGFPIRRIQDLALIRNRHPVFLFGWTLLHVIDEASPLAGATEQSLNAARAYLLLTVIGTDETTGQSLMARQEYPASAIRWNHRYADILSTDTDGVDHFDYTRFQDVEALE
jgi:inward rectifier potassium channel